MTVGSAPTWKVNPQEEGHFLNTVSEKLFSMVTKLIQIAFSYKGIGLLLLLPANEESSNDVIWRIEINLFYTKKANFEKYCCKTRLPCWHQCWRTRQDDFKIFSGIYLGKVATFGGHSLVVLEVSLLFKWGEGLNRVEIQFRVFTYCSYCIFSIL